MATAKPNREQRHHLLTLAVQRLQEKANDFLQAEEDAHKVKMRAAAQTFWDELRKSKKLPGSVEIGERSLHFSMPSTTPSAYGRFARGECIAIRIILPSLAHYQLRVATLPENHKVIKALVHDIETLESTMILDGLDTAIAGYDALIKKIDAL